LQKPLPSLKRMVLFHVSRATSILRQVNEILIQTTKLELGSKEFKELVKALGKDRIQFAVMSDESELPLVISTGEPSRFIALAKKHGIEFKVKK